MPTKDELLSIVDATRTHPSIDVVAFPNTPLELFWSSSPYLGPSNLGAPGGAWYVGFSYGNSGNIGKGYAGRVRCVR